MSGNLAVSACAVELSQEFSKPRDEPKLEYCARERKAAVRRWKVKEQTGALAQTQRAAEDSCQAHVELVEPGEREFRVKGREVGHAAKESTDGGATFIPGQAVRRKGGNP